MRPLCIFLFLTSFLNTLFATPQTEIPNELVDQFTMNKKIPVLHWYFDNTLPDSEFQITLDDGSKASFYSRDLINTYIEKIKLNQTFYYGNTDLWLYKALEKYPILGKEVVIIGSTVPWYESVVIAYGGYPTTIEYNKIVSDDDRLTLMTVEEFNNNPKKFDVILSISSIEHDGLGRYGDPINPTGDLEFMATAKEKYLREDGVMILAVPTGRDCLTWNAHRIYGPLRLPLLLKEWNLIDTFGFRKSAFRNPLGDQSYQPIYYLSPIKS
jgi:hypothetical protein